jgi:hypothetical protein
MTYLSECSHEGCTHKGCECGCHGIIISYEEAKYLVESIQHEYLNKETYYFASSLFERLAQFVRKHDNSASYVKRTD